MKFELPPLPYAKSALEPHLSARTLEFHYEKHHRGYLTKLEKAIGGKPEAERSLVDIIRSAQGPVFNNAAQLWNHSFYWDSLKPGGSAPPRGTLAQAIQRDLQGYDNFARKFAEVAASRFGSGWAWLVVDERGKLDVVSTHDAETPIAGNSKPLIALDVWEHAYYLDYQNERRRYIQAFLEHLANWSFAEKNFASAR
jgi:Fe-Mn family superoxide dismutase